MKTILKLVPVIGISIIIKQISLNLRTLRIKIRDDWCSGHKLVTEIHFGIRTFDFMFILNTSLVYRLYNVDNWGMHVVGKGNWKDREVGKFFPNSCLYKEDC